MQSFLKIFKIRRLAIKNRINCLMGGWQVRRVGNNLFEIRERWV